MIGDLFRRQEYAKQVLDLAEADPHGECGDDQLSQFGIVDEDSRFGLAFQSGDHVVEALILRAELGDDFSGGLAIESSLDLTGVFIDGLAAASGEFGLSS